MLCTRWSFSSYKLQNKICIWWLHENRSYDAYESNDLHLSPRRSSTVELRIAGNSPLSTVRFFKIRNAITDLENIYWMKHKAKSGLQQTFLKQTEAEAHWAANMAGFHLLNLVEALLASTSLACPSAINWLIKLTSIY